MAKSSDDHVRIRNVPGGFEMFCEHCGKVLLIVPPISMEMFRRMAEQFVKEHRYCRRPTTKDQDNHDTQ